MNLQNEKILLTKKALQLDIPSNYIIFEDGKYEHIDFNELKSDDISKEKLLQIANKFKLSENDILYLYTFLNFEDPKELEYVKIDYPFLENLDFTLRNFDQIKTNPNLLRNKFLQSLEGIIADQNINLLKQFLEQNYPNNTDVSIYKKEIENIERAMKGPNAKLTFVDEIFGPYNVKLLRKLFPTSNDINLYLGYLKPYERFLIKYFLKKIEDEEEVTNEELLNVEFESLPSVSFEPFNVKKNQYKIQIKFEEGKIPLEYIYDNIKVNHNIPYCKFNQYYKLYQEFIPEKDWINTDIDQDKIYLRLYNGILLLIQLYEDENQQHYLETIVDKDSLTSDNIIDFVKTVILLQFNIIDVNISDIIGNYYIPKQTFNRFLLADLTLTNTQFKRFLIKNDNIRPSRKGKKDSKERVVNILNLRYYDPINHSEIKVKISPKIMTKSEFDLIDKPDIFKIGDNLIKISLSAKNYQAITNFQNIFSKLLSLYNSKEKELYDIYKYYLPDFELHTSPSYLKSEEDYNLRDYAPHIFKKKYTSLCGTKRNPQIVDIYNMNFLETIPNNKSLIKAIQTNNPEKIETEFDKDPRFLLFPKNELVGPRQWYYCGQNEKHPNIGLVKNNLENADQITYLPCCFKDIQKGNNKFLAYTRDDVGIDTKITRNVRIITTHKFANEDDQLGILPNNLNIFFGLFSQGLKYYRKGTSNSKSTFLECVLYALNINNYKTRNVEERKKITINERKKISSLTQYNFAKQECYDMTNQEIKQALSNLNEYLDPLRYIKVLEEIYKVDIYLFTRDKEESANYSLPRFINGYYRNFKAQRKSIMIYEHLGGIWNNEKKCELIVRKSITEDIADTSLFQYDDDVIKEILKVELQLYRFFLLQKPIIRTFLLPGNISKQYIDNYGKGRVLKVDNIIVFTSPIEPVNLELLNEEEIYIENNYDKVMEFIKKYNLEIIQQNVIDNYVKELVIKHNNQEYTISITSIKPLDNITIVNKSIIPRFEDSMFDDHIFMEKYSRQLFEFILYNYSIYLNTNSLIHNDNSLDNFINNKIRISEYDEYKLFDYKLNNNKDNLIVYNNDILEGIKYNISVIINNNNYDRVINYHKQSFMMNYYKNIYDFKQYSNTTLLQGNQSLYQWMENTSTYKISHHLDTFSQYDLISINDFIMNKFNMKIEDLTISNNVINNLVSDDVYIIYPATSLDNALYIGKIWAEYGYITLTGEISGLEHIIIHEFPGKMITIPGGEEMESNKIPAAPTIRRKGIINNDYNIIIRGIVKKYKKTQYSVLLNLKYRKEPMFLRYNNENYIIQPTPNEYIAKKTSYYYNQLGYNPTNIDLLEDIDDDLMYNIKMVNSDGYITNNSIVNGKENDFNITIVVQKILDKQLYYAMFKLN